MTIKIMPRRLLSLQPSITWPRLILTVLILVNCIYFGLYATQRHLAFETGAFDTGVYAQPLWNYIQGNNFSLSLTKDDGPLRWANHVEPILFLIVPLYALWPDPRLLFWLQVTALSLAAVPIYALATRRLHHEWGALVIVLAYFLMPATQSVALFDFHAVALAPFLLLSAVCFLDGALAARNESFWLWPKLSSGIQEPGRGGEPSSFPLPPHAPTRWQRLIQTLTAPTKTHVLYLLSGLFFLLALSTKEDISLHVFMIGMYLLVLRQRWWEGSVLTVVSLAWFYVAFQVVIPTFRTGGGHSIFVSWFETLGSSPLEIALSPLTRPADVLAVIFRSDNLPPLAMITLPMALLPWAGLPVFILTIPSLAFSLLSQNPTPRQLETWHYAAPMLAFITLGTIDGLARLAYYTSRFGRKGSSFRPKVFHNTLVVLAMLLLTTSLIYHYFRGYTPLSQLHEWPDVTAHHQLGREIAATIPPETSVLAQAQLVPYVAHRQDLTIWSGPLDTNFDYIWLDLSHRKLPNRANAHGDLLIGLIIETTFGIVVNTDGYIVLKNGAAREVIGQELFTFTEFEQPPANAWPFSATFGDTLKLIAVEPEIRRLATSETEPQVILYFDTLQPPGEDYYLFLYLLEPDGTIVGATEYPQPGLFWWPTSRWQTGDRRQIRVNTIPWWTGDKTIFGYAIGLSRTEDPWDIGARLPVVLTDPAPNPAGSKPLDNNTLLPITAFRRFGGLAYPKPLTILSGVDPNHLGSKN